MLQRSNAFPSVTKRHRGLRMVARSSAPDDFTHIISACTTGCLIFELLSRQAGWNLRHWLLMSRFPMIHSIGQHISIKTNQSDKGLIRLHDFAAIIHSLLKTFISSFLDISEVPRLPYWNLENFLTYQVNHTPIWRCKTM